MNILRYLGLVINRSAQNSILLTDRLSILIVPFATLAMWSVGAKMTDTIQETLFLGVGITVLAVVVLRLLAAPYWLWCDDQAAKKKLTAEIERPEREIEAAMKAFTLELRKRLSEQLGKLVSMTHFASAKFPFGGKVEKAADDLLELDQSIHALVSQLSYDMPLRIACLQLRAYCFQLIHAKLRADDAALDMLWKQRKLTFRILHRDHQIDEIVSLIELEILLEEQGKSLSPTGQTGEAESLIAEMKEMLKKIGNDLHKPEFADFLRSQLQNIRANRL